MSAPTKDQQIKILKDGFASMKAKWVETAKELDRAAWRLSAAESENARLRAELTTASARAESGWNTAHRLDRQKEEIKQLARKLAEALRKLMSADPDCLGRYWPALNDAGIALNAARSAGLLPNAAQSGGENG